jgi:hypothetical protein
VRAYQTDVKLFLDYATDPAYDLDAYLSEGTTTRNTIRNFIQ